MVSIRVRMGQWNINKHELGCRVIARDVHEFPHREMIRIATQRKRLPGPNNLNCQRHHQNLKKNKNFVKMIYNKILISIFLIFKEVFFFFFSKSIQSRFELDGCTYLVYLLLLVLNSHRILSIVLYVYQCLWFSWVVEMVQDVLG